MKTETQTEGSGQGKRRRGRIYSAKEKSQAVLALWSGRRSTSALTRELGVPWGVLNAWEKRAITGMLRALDPTWTPDPERERRLPERVERLLEQAVKPAEPQATT